MEKDRFDEKATKADLKQLVVDEVCGGHRVPALYFNEPFACAKHVQLDEYEILPVEPLHTIGGHIKNVYNEVQEHLEKKSKKVFQNLIISSFSGKEAKRCADYRLSLVQCTKAIEDQQMFSKELTELFTTLAEIQSILYMDEGRRTPKQILRLYNLTFLHAIGLKTLKMTVKNKRKLFGQYYHVLISHAPQQFRIISLASCNAEDEERQFNFLKTVSASTSNHHPENVLANAFIRLQVKQQWKNERPTGVTDVEAKISKAYKYSEHRDTVISFDAIKKFPFEYQAHLERIADYLVEEEIWEATTQGIKMFDISGKFKKKKHSFRSPP